MPEVGQKTTDGLAPEALNRGVQDVPCIIECSVTSEQQILQFRPADVRVAPRRCCSVEAIQILFGDPARFEKIIVLFGPGNRREDIERRSIWTKTAEHVQVLANSLGRVFRETNDVRKMAQDSVFPAQLYDLAIRRWVILRLVHGQQRLTAE